MCIFALGVLASCGSSNENVLEKDNTNQDSLKLATEVETMLKNAKLEGKVDSTKDTLTTILHFTPPPDGNPQVEGGPEWSISPLIYDYLVDFSSQPENEYKPQLLENFSWEKNVLTMTLKENLKYSDGGPINADELLNNIYLDQTNLQVQSYAESIEKVDDLTIRIVYTQVQT